MQEVKTPKKPFIFYLVIVMAVMMLLNMFVFPSLMSPEFKEVDYGEFLKMAKQVLSGIFNMPIEMHQKPIKDD